MNKYTGIFLLALLLPLLSSPLHALRIKLKFMPPRARITIISGGKTNKVSNPYSARLKNGKYTINVQSPGYISRSFSYDEQQKKIRLEEKLEKKYDGLELIGIYKVSGQPKSVVWLDNQRFVVNLLSGPGIELFEFTNHIGVIPASNYAEKLGFVEGYIDHSNNTYIQSQMTTGSFHIYDLDTLQYKETHSTKGVWTKVIEASSQYYFFANWLSTDITVFDRYTYKFIKKIKMAGIPRGLALTHDEKYLYSSIFDDALIQKIDLKTLKIVKSIRLSPYKGAARHIVTDMRNKVMYISDMRQAIVYKFDYRKDKVIGSTKVFSKPNTIVLSPDGHRLFVSCRGPNGPKGYLEKGPLFGQVYIIDTPTMKAENWIWGLNQTTGLDISPNGRYLVLGDFIDHKIEIYRVKTGLIHRSYNQ